MSRLEFSYRHTSYHSAFSPPRPGELFASKRPCHFPVKLGEVVGTPEESPFEVFPGRVQRGCQPRLITKVEHVAGNLGTVYALNTTLRCLH